MFDSAIFLAPVLAKNIWPLLLLSGFFLILVHLYFLELHVTSIFSELVYIFFKGQAKRKKWVNLFNNLELQITPCFLLWRHMSPFQNQSSPSLHTHLSSTHCKVSSHSSVSVQFDFASFPSKYGTKKSNNSLQ